MERRHIPKTVPIDGNTMDVLVLAALQVWLKANENPKMGTCVAAPWGRSYTHERSYMAAIRFIHMWSMWPRAWGDPKIRKR